MLASLRIPPQWRLTVFLPVFTAVVLTVISVVLHEQSSLLEEFRAKTSLIEPGDTAERVVEVLGPPANIRCEQDKAGSFAGQSFFLPTDSRFAEVMASDQTKQYYYLPPTIRFLTLDKLCIIEITDNVVVKVTHIH